MEAKNETKNKGNGGVGIAWLGWYVIAFVLAPWLFVEVSERIEGVYISVGQKRGHLGRLFAFGCGALTFSGATLQFYLIDRFVLGFITSSIDMHVALFWALVIPMCFVCLYVLYSWFIGLVCCIRSTILLARGAG